MARRKRNVAVNELETVKTQSDAVVASKLLDDAMHSSREFFDTLSDAEKQTALMIFAELQDNSGDSLTYDYLWELHYKTKPVSIQEFLDDNYYIGWMADVMYPKWREVIEEIFAPGAQYMEVIFCLAGDTRIPLLDGNEKTLKELYEGYQKDENSIDVFSVNQKTGQPVPGRCTKVTKFGKDQLYKVNIVGGGSFRANADHEMVCIDLVKRKVKDLKAGDLLMPFISSNAPTDIAVILSITKDIKESVYCLTVPEWGNFAISIGNKRAGLMSGNTGSIGSGKSSIAAVIYAYLIYRMSCLKSPATYYSLFEGSNIVFGVYSVTQSQAQHVGFGKLRAILERAPYFQQQFPFDNRIQKRVKFNNSTMEVVHGCVAEGTKVLTPQGWVGIEDLAETSSEVMTSDGVKVYPSTYKGVKCTGYKKCLSIKTEFGDNLICSYDHKIITEDENGNRIWKRAEEFKEGEIVFRLRRFVVDDSLEKWFSNQCDMEIQKSKIAEIVDGGTIKTYDVVEVPVTHTVITQKILTSNSRELHLLGKDVFSLYLDEVNFMESKTTQPNRGVDLKEEEGQAYEIYNAARSRIMSRFMRPGGSVPGMTILISSKTNQLSFLDKHIQKVKEDIDKKKVYVADFARWEVQPASRFILKKFKVQVGDAVRASKILKDGEESPVGATIVEVPGEFKDEFEMSIERALREVAGVATQGLSPLFREMKTITDCIDTTRKHPFTKQVVSISTMSEIEIIDYLINDRLFDVKGGSLSVRLNPSIPRAIHLDLALNGDRAGFAMGHISGLRKVKKMRADYTYYFDYAPEIVVDIVLSIELLEQGQIDFGKIRTFINALNDFGFNIKSLSADRFQSADTLQIFKKMGWDTGIISVDTTTEPYMYLKQVCLDKRISYYDYPLLNKELKDLEYDMDKDKIDHPKNSSKDAADAVAGMVYNLMKMKSILKTSSAIPLSMSGGSDNEMGKVTAQQLRKYNTNVVVPGEFKVDMDVLATEVLKCLEQNKVKNPLLDD